MNTKEKNKQDEIKEYFTDDVRTQVREMSNEDMRTLLKELEGTPTWFAILKYNQERISTVQNSFLSLDPVKEPTKIARYQGAITGMLDLQDAILNLKFNAKRAENPDNKNEQNKNELGGAYSEY